MVSLYSIARVLSVYLENSGDILDDDKMNLSIRSRNSCSFGQAQCK